MPWVGWNALFPFPIDRSISILLFLHVYYKAAEKLSEV